MLAEFLVARALGCEASVRDPWAAYDLCTPGGIKVEVKSAAHLQSWFQRRLSPIRFSIAPARGWDGQTGRWADEVGCCADVYVFCLLDHRDKRTVDPLRVEQWRFWVVGRRELDRVFPRARSLSLQRLLQLEPIEASFAELSGAVAAVAAC